MQTGQLPSHNTFLIVKLQTGLEQYYMLFFLSKGILYFFLLLYLRSFRRALIDILKCKKGQTQEKQINIAMEAFLCSQMNMELVCSILQGIHNSLQKIKTLYQTDSKFQVGKLKGLDFRELNYIHIRRLELLKQDLFTSKSIKHAIAVRKAKSLKKMSTKLLSRKESMMSADSQNFDRLFKIINV